MMSLVDSVVWLRLSSGQLLMHCDWELCRDKFIVSAT